MRDIALSLKFLPDFSVDFSMIFLENVRGFLLKSTTILSPMNPPKIPLNSARNI